jgi:hypothetical protein
MLWLDLLFFRKRRSVPVLTIFLMAIYSDGYPLSGPQKPAFEDAGISMPKTKKAWKRLETHRIPDFNVHNAHPFHSVKF